MSEMEVAEQALLEPLRQVKAGRFEVILPVMDGLERSGKFDDALFVIRRPLNPVKVGESNVDKRGPGYGGFL